MEMTVEELKNSLPQTGHVEWIGLSSSRRSKIEPVSEAVVEVNTGIKGDHHVANGTGRSIREVTFIQAEHLPVVAALLGRDTLSAGLLRRNVVVAGINLLALKDKQFRVGDVVLQGTGPCAPCSRMEENLGPGGYNAMRGHGGITSQVIKAGTIRIGDEVALLPQPEST